jgi:hypothetical protein
MYLVFHSRDFPETPQLALDSHALQRCKFSCDRSVEKGILLGEQTNFLTVISPIIPGIFMKINTS